MFNTLSVVPVIGFDGVANAFANVRVIISSQRPDHANIGDVWYDPITNERWIYTNIGWQIDTGTVTHTSPPTDPDVGDFWFDDTTDILYQWDGTEWVAVGGVLQPSTKSITLPYSQPTFSAAKAIQLNYSELTKVPTELIIVYEGMLVASSLLKLVYAEEAKDVGITGVFNYTIENGRPRYPLFKGFEAQYSLANPTPVSKTTTFTYTDAAKVTAALKALYSDTQVIANTLVCSYGKADVAALFIANYSDAEPIVANLTCIYTDAEPIVSTLVATYADAEPAISNLVCLYSDAEPIVSTLVFNYSDSEPVVANLVFNYADVEPVVSTLVCKYKDLVAVSMMLASSWRHVSPVTLSNTFPYDITIKEFAALSGRFGYSIQKRTLQTIQATPTLLHGGKEIDFITIQLSADENSPYWIGDILLSRLEDFVTFTVGGAVEIVFNDQTFNMIVDGLDIARSEDSNEYKLSCISPTAALDSPFAQTISKSYSTATLANEVVSDALGTVTWNLPNWLVPVTQLQFSNTTPMQIARTITESIGGVVESTPEGDIICRKAYPVNVPDFVGMDIPDTEVFSVSETIAPQRLMNKVDLYTSDFNTIQDSLEYVNTDGVSGTVYAYPRPDRLVTLSHTGAPDVVINPTGIDSRIETETIEFKQGLASTKYPIEEITSMQWKYTNLGAVTFTKNEIQSAIDGESLLLISYRVVSYKFNVQGTELTQFTLNG